LAATVEVVAVKFAKEDPAATMTDAGTLTAGLLLERATAAPPMGAQPDNVTVHVLGNPPRSVAGEQASEITTGAETVRDAVWDAPPKEAVRVTDCVAATAEVLAMKTPVEYPAARLIDACTLTAALLLDRAITTPEAGAGPESVAVQVLDTPPGTVAGEHPREMITGADTVRAAV
jgi:hypothetical protein